jgi:RimJ/RimL family protein N-acetyltransferase
MKVELVLPTPDGAGFWLKVRIQKSTQENNPIGILSEERLRQQIIESSFEISERNSVHRYFIQAADGNFAGVISLKDINWESGVCELGYLIAEDYQGKGIATRAVEKILEKAFAAGITKIKATTSVQNTPSYRVLQRNGFGLEGFLRNEFIVQGKPHDAYLWAVSRDLFESSKRDFLPEGGVRAARVTDLEPVFRLSHELGYSPRLDEVQSHLSKILCHPDYEVVVIEKAGEVVGWMTLYKRLRIEDSEFLQVAAVVTDKRFRGQGLGKSLMAYAERKARAFGLPFIGLNSSKPREMAHKFYEQIGYIKSKESYFFKKEISLDE